MSDQETHLWFNEITKETYGLSFHARITVGGTVDTEHEFEIDIATSSKNNRQK